MFVFCFKSESERSATSQPSPQKLRNYSLKQQNILGYTPLPQVMCSSQHWFDDTFTHTQSLVNTCENKEDCRIGLFLDKHFYSTTLSAELLRNTCSLSEYLAKDFSALGAALEEKKRIVIPEETTERSLRMSSLMLSVGEILYRISELETTTSQPQNASPSCAIRGINVVKQSSFYNRLFPNSKPLLLMNTYYLLTRTQIMNFILRYANTHVRACHWELVFRCGLPQQQKKL